MTERRAGKSHTAHVSCGALILFHMVTHMREKLCPESMSAQSMSAFIESWTENTDGRTFITPKCKGPVFAFSFSEQY